MTRRLRHEHLLCLGAFLGPLMAVFAPHGMVPLTAAMAVGCLLLAPSAVLPRGWSPWVLLPFIALPLWAAITSLWGIVPRGSFYAALQLGVVIAIGVVLVASARHVAEPFRKPLMVCLVAGAILAWGLLLGMAVGIDGVTLIQRLFVPSAPGRSVVAFGRGFVVLMVLAPLIVLTGWRLAGWQLALPLAMMAVASVFVTHSIAVKGGVVLVLAAAALSYRWGGKTASALRAVLMVIILAAPIVPHFFPAPEISWETMRWIPSSTHHRMTIWKFTATRIAEKPIFGWGMDAARDIPGGEESVILVRDDVESPEQLMPLHPHDAWLQVWLELGAFGAVIAGVLWCGMIEVPLRSPNPLVRSAMTASLVAAIVAASVSFGTWQSWWLCSLVLAAALWAPFASRE